MILLANFIDELTVALSASALTWAGQRGYKSFKNFMFERNVSVTGQYITHFVDTKDGNRVTSVAEATIKQSGKSMKGVTTILDSSAGKEREWLLTGEVMPDGNILGHYICTTKFQSGVGTFSLRALSTGHLEGHWSGYDSDNKIMNHGEYTFTRIEDISIVNFERKHLNGVLKIASLTLGDGYLDNLLEADKSKNNSLKVAISKKTKKILGFCFGYMIGPKTLCKTLEIDDDLPIDIKILDGDGKIGIMKTIAVSPDKQGRGIGLRLLRECEANLASKGAQMVISPAWAVDKNINAASILHARGFEKWLHINEYWKADCDSGAFKCPAREEECRCSVAFFVKHLN